MDYLKRNKWLCILALLFLIIRLPLLGQMYLLHDERDIVMSGYSIAKTGRDLYGNFMPINFTGINPDNPLFAIYFSALGWLVMPWRSVVTARLPFVLISTSLIFLVYEVIYEITKNKRLALLTTIIFCFSPWIFHLTRLAMDVTVAIVYLLSGILFYLKKKRLPAYVLFFLTFYTYQGFRVLIPFLLIYLELFHYSNKRDTQSFIKNSITSAVVFFLLVGSILFIDARVTANRFDQLIFSKNESIAADVNFKRSTTIAHPLVSRIFYNKATASVDYVITTFIKGQDFSYLFKNGDYSAINGNASAGQFFLVFFILYYLGLFALGKRFDKNNWYIAGFALLGLLPAIVRAGSVTFSIRAMLSALGFAYILALGYELGRKTLDNFSPLLKKLIMTVLIGTLLINVIYFGYDFYARRPISVGEQFNANEINLVDYMQQTNREWKVYHKYPYEPYMSYVFLDNTVDFITVQQILAQKKPYAIGGTSFVPCVPYKTLLKVEQSVIHEGCLKEEEHRTYPNLRKVMKGLPYQDYTKKTAYFFVE